MIRKKMLTSKTIIQKIGQLEAEHLPSDKPYIAFIGKLPDGRYEVVEHIGVGKGKGSLKYKSVKHNTMILDTKEEYLSQNPDWVVIHGEEDLSDVLEDLIHDDYSKIKIENEGMIKQ